MMFFSDKPSVISCYLAATAVADYATLSTSGCTGCEPKLKNCATLTWTCTQLPQQDTSMNTYFMAVSEFRKCTDLYTFCFRVHRTEN